MLLRDIGEVIRLRLQPGSGLHHGLTGAGSAGNQGELTGAFFRKLVALIKNVDAVLRRRQNRAATKLEIR